MPIACRIHGSRLHQVLGVAITKREIVVHILMAIPRGWCSQTSVYVFPIVTVFINITIIIILLSREDLFLTA